MKQNRVTTIATYCLLGSAAGVSLILPRHLAMPMVYAAPPPKLEITGVVRDFHSSHPDFGLSGSTGFITGSVADSFGSFSVPEFTGAGVVVTASYRDSANNPISPIWFDRYDPPLACFQAPGISTNGPVMNTNTSMVDSFDSTLGPYGGTNIGADAIVATNATTDDVLSVVNTSTVNGDVYVGPGGNPSTAFELGSSSTVSGTVDALNTTIPMPTLNAPRDLSRLPSLGDIKIITDRTIDQDMHLDQLEIEGAIVTIDGEVTILCDDDFILEKKGSVLGGIELLPGAQLRLYVMGDTDIESPLNMTTGDPSLCTIYKIGAGEVRADSADAKVVARILAPEASLVVRNSAEVFGTFVGNIIDLDNKAQFHVDVSTSGLPNIPPDVAGATGGGSLANVASASSFRSWFRDEPGANISGTYTMTLDPNGGAYQFKTATFDPIGDLYFGDEGAAQNYGFTFSFAATFVAQTCGGHFMEFEGDDNLWVFIDDVLVMDVGGVNPGTGQYLDLNRMSLDDGRTYTLKFYYAQRNTSSSAFTLRTNIPLVTSTVSRTVSAQYD